MNCRLSVVIPVYNGTRYLREAIDSVLAQSRVPDEVLVVDDGSDDHPEKVVHEYAGRVRCLRQDNRGAAAARNAGILATRGEFLAFLDQDDRWHEEKLHLQLARFEADPELDLCYTHADLFWEPELASEAMVFAEHPRARSVPSYVAPALLARRSAFDRIGLLDPALRFGDGTEWALRAMDAGLRVHLLPNVLVYHRMHPHNLTREREASKQEFVRIVRNRLRERRRHQSTGTLPAGGPA